MRTTVRSSHRSIRNYDITLIHFGPTTTTTKHTHSIECLYNLPKFAKNASFRWKKVPQATDLYRAFNKTLYAMLQFMFAVGKSSQEKKCINSVVHYNTILSNAMNQTVLLAICIFFSAAENSKLKYYEFEVDFNHNTFGNTFCISSIASAPWNSGTFYHCFLFCFCVDLFCITLL